MKIREVGFVKLQGILDSNKHSIVYFFAKWCPEYEQIIRTMNKVSTIKCDSKMYMVSTRKSKIVLKEYSIEDDDTIIFFNKKKIYGRLVGELGASDIMKMAVEAEKEGS